MGEKRLNTAFGDDLEIKRILLFATKLLGITPSSIHKYIPIIKGQRNTFAFNCLLNIYSQPRLSKGGYAAIFGTCRDSTSLGIDYLFELGLVRKIGKPRLIIPFQKFKVDTGYVISEKGRSVIISVFKDLGII